MLRFMLLIVLMMASSVHAIIIRHDRDDARYRKLAEGYPMVCRVGHGMGTLLGPKWVITAAHVVDGLAPEAVAVRFADREIAVAQVSIHPDYAKEGSHRDIALLRLDEPITDIPRAHVYRDGDELGQRVIFVGDGLAGNGQSGPVKGERILRAAHNTVDSVCTGWLVFTFDAPPGGDDLEGISGPGDSGGPALLKRGDSLFVIGISAYNDGEIECGYNSREYYSRISDELTWIERTVLGTWTTAVGERMLRMYEDEHGKQAVSSLETSSVEIPVSDDSAFIRVLGELTESMASNSVGDFNALFTKRIINITHQEAEMVEGMHKFMVDGFMKRGPIAGFHPLTGKGFQIPDSNYPMRPVTFHLEDGISGYFGIALDDSGKIDHLSVFVREGICPHGKDCPEMMSLKDLKRAADE